MNVIKNFENNDVYFIEIVMNKIIINNNYEGIIILDEQLNVIKSIKLTEQLIIDTAFIKDKEIVLFDYENQRLIYTNLESYDFRTIELSDEFEDIILTPYYEWIDHNLFLINYDSTFIACIDLPKGSAVTMNRDLLGELNITIQDTWNNLIKYVIHKVYPRQHLAIVENNNTLMLVDFKNNTLNEVNIETIKFHDIRDRKIKYSSN